MKKFSRPRPVPAGQRAEKKITQHHCIRIYPKVQRQSSPKNHRRREVMTFFKEELGSFKHVIDSSGCTSVDSPVCNCHALVVNTKAGSYQCFECGEECSSFRDFRRMLDGQEVIR